MARTNSDVAEPSEFVLAVSPSYLLQRAQQMAADRFSVLVGEDSLTLRQFTVLAAVEAQPGLSQTDLVRATGIDRSTLADMMVRMQKRGWLIRQASRADARANAVTLTPAGASMMQWACQHAKAADAAIMDVLPGAKRKAFQAILLRLAKIANKAVADAEHALNKKARRKAREILAKEKKAKARAKEVARAARAKRPSKNKH